MVYNAVYVYSNSDANDANDASDTSDAKCHLI